MAQRDLGYRVENLERRMTTVEQILPTLATKADLLAAKTDLEAAMALLATKAELQAAIAPLATKAELQAAIAPLATKAEVKAEIKAEGEETRRHFDIVAESLGADIRMVAEGLVALVARVDAQHAAIKGVLVEHDRRLMRLESSRPGPQ